MLDAYVKNLSLSPENLQELLSFKLKPAVFKKSIDDKTILAFFTLKGYLIDNSG